MKTIHHSPFTIGSHHSPSPLLRPKFASRRKGPCGSEGPERPRSEAAGHPAWSIKASHSSKQPREDRWSSIDPGGMPWSMEQTPSGIHLLKSNQAGLRTARSFLAGRPVPGPGLGPGAVPVPGRWDPRTSLRIVVGGSNHSRVAEPHLPLRDPEIKGSPFGAMTKNGYQNWKTKR